MQKCRVWQLNQEAESQRIFTPLEDYTRKHGAPQMGDYHTVFDGEVETNDLEALYTKFNNVHPESYTGHSLSMSDVVELYDDSGSSYHYCDVFGFEEISFHTPQQKQEMQL